MIILAYFRRSCRCWVFEFTVNLLVPFSPLTLLIPPAHQLKCEELIVQKSEENNQICKKEYNIAINWLLCAIAYRRNTPDKTSRSGHIKFWLGVLDICSDAATTENL